MRLVVPYGIDSAKIVNLDVGGVNARGQGRGREGVGFESEAKQTEKRGGELPSVRRKRKWRGRSVGEERERERIRGKERRVNKKEKGLCNLSCGRVLPCGPIRH